MIIIDQARFFANLRLTQAYCKQQLQNNEKPEWLILRSTINLVCEDGKWFAHVPTHDMAVSEAQSISWEDWTKKSDPYYLDSFVELFDKQLEFKNIVLGEQRYYDSYQGKILVIEYGSNIPDGAVEPETEGFFDEWDLPPIDTWFYNDYSDSSNGILFAWIPEKFIEIANTAIKIQFLDILSWFEKPSNWKKLTH